MRVELRRALGPPEDAVGMRVVVALAVELAVVAVVAQHAVDVSTAAAALVLAPLGYVFSYRRRMRPSLAVKLVLTVGLLAAMGRFLQAIQLVGSVDEARIPLASLFLWVQVLHAFDVPRRRDLAFSMVSSVILMAEAGALSLTTSYLLFLAPWAGLGGAWLYLSARPRPDRVAMPASVRRMPPGSRRAAGRLAPVRAAAMPAAASLVAGLVIFMAMPRVPGSFVKTPPFSLQRDPSDVAGFDGGVANPGLPSAGTDGVVDFAPGAYPGLSDVVDLRARGRLSDDIAFRVRASQAALWRAEVFDVYDGTTWTIDSKATQSLPQSGDTGSFDLPPISGNAPMVAADTTELTQTFYIDTPQPNVVFAAASPSRVYFPSGGLRADRYGSIRSPILLDEGLVYSVISTVLVTDPAMLRRAARAAPWRSESPLRLPDPWPAQLAPYLRVPDTLPSRVGDLAATVTAGATDEYEAATRVQAWIQEHTEYDLDAPPDPAGVDEVDHFLFATRRGFCEQIASAMAVMLRTLGVPTRLVTGYGPGERNPFTGYFEVKQSDAHAWLEVLYPGVGWVPYDPTFGVPQANPGVASRFLAGPLFAAIGRFATAVTPMPVKRAFGATLGFVAGTARLALRTWQAALATVTTVTGAVLLWRRRRRRRRRGPPPHGAAAAFAELTEALAARGHERDPHETPSEYLREVAADEGLGVEVATAAELVVRTFERERFSPGAPAPEDLERAREAAVRVRRLVGSR